MVNGIVKSLLFILLLTIFVLSASSFYAQGDSPLDITIRPPQPDNRVEYKTAKYLTSLSRSNRAEHSLQAQGDVTPTDILILTDDQAEYPIGLHMEILEDKEKQWTIEDVTTPHIAAQFLPSSEEAPGFGFTDSAYWIRFRVRNEASSDIEWLVLYEPTAFFIDYYLPSVSGEGYDVFKTGSALPFDTRDVPVGRFVFHLPVAPQESTTIYMRFTSEGSLILVLTLLSDDSFLQQAMVQQAVNSLLYGILLIITIYNLVLFFNLRDRSYLYYVLFFSTMLLGIMALDGFAGQYLWPNQGQFAAIAPRLFMILSFNFGLLFAISFLRTKEYVPRLNIIMTSLAILVFVFIGLQFIWFRETAIIHVFLMIASGISMLLAGIVVWQKGYQPARFFLIGWSVVLVGFIIFILTLVDVISLNILTNAVLRMGLIVLALVLSAGLAERINIYRQERNEAIFEERIRLARDLHDSTTQSLYSALLFSETGKKLTERGDLEEAAYYQSRVSDVVHEALKEMRLLVFELRPLKLEQEGLVGALQMRLDAVESRSGIEARLHAEDIRSLPPRISENLYYVTQEALNNSLKHANADKVMVDIEVNGKNLMMDIIDDGQGFNLEDAYDRGGMGLVNMHERIKNIDGELKIQSKPGEGTKIEVSIPMEKVR
jgi:signal transduction histidine kinase